VIIEVVEAIVGGMVIRFESIENWEKIEGCEDFLIAEGE
jgi:hypothetical protein